jgi:FKBP-type peptidyl-prolyl cis-trans isomerase
MKANEANVKMSEDYLVNNKKRKGVTTTTSGLQYEIMKAADNPGPKPVATDKVKVHYVGTTVDGQEFDSSVRRGQPAEFPLGGVIKGWTEGLQYMNVGDKYKFVIPQNLAYGERSPSAKIKPFSTLIFEVELLEITTNK